MSFVIDFAILKEMKRSLFQVMFKCLFVVIPAESFGYSLVSKNLTVHTPKESRDVPRLVDSHLFSNVQFAFRIDSHSDELNSHHVIQLQPFSCAFGKKVCVD